MTKLQEIITYQGYAIMVWIVTAGWMAGTKYFKVGIIEHPTLKGAQAEIEYIKS